MNKTKIVKSNLTTKILISMFLGGVIGLLLNYFKPLDFFLSGAIDDILDIGGQIFISLLMMLVVPIVFVSLVCGIFNLGQQRRFGALALKTISLYMLTTVIAVTVALSLASLFHVGSGVLMPTDTQFISPEPISLKDTILGMFPRNPFASLASGDLLEIIIFTIFFGLAISWSGKSGERIIIFFQDLDEIIIKLVSMIISIAPYGVFCLVAYIFSQVGFSLIYQLIGYFAMVLLILLIQLLVTYPILLRFIGGLPVAPFYRKMFPTFLFAFSISSSNATIPVVLETTTNKLGIKEKIGSFIVPLGATINMDGTVIMQGVATVFIANMYGIDLGIIERVTIVALATIASVGTAGIPSAGLITLTLVLTQVGIPIDGIALIIGVDRLLDMSRTAVNVTGDALVTTIVGKSENSIDLDIYNDTQ